MNRAKVGKGQVWCIVCKTEGNTVNDYPSLRTGVAAPNPTPLPTRVLGNATNEYCDICLVYGTLPICSLCYRSIPRPLSPCFVTSVGPAPMAQKNVMPCRPSRDI